MVLFKRKPVQFLPTPEIENDETEVWEIKQTGEIFVDYESYLARVDFYKQRRFICEITGHSGLSFFEALESELTGAQEVEEAFPEALKGPILRRIQFQTVSRIDTLVDLIYDEFRADYYPGEAVTVHVVNGEKLSGIVRDKTSFGAKMSSDGTLNPPFSRYFVSLDNRPKEEAVVDDAHIFRDRKIFTKQVLRSFIKKTVTRESWSGAPWQVKHDVAKQHHIDIRIPQHLLYESKAAEKKSKPTQVKALTENNVKIESFQGSYDSNGRLLELKSALEIHKNKKNSAQQQIRSKQQALNSPIQSGQKLHLGSHNFQAFGSPPQMNSQQIIFQNSPLAFPSIPLYFQSQAPPPPIKFPIDDLQIPPRLDGFRRPKLKFLSLDTPSTGKAILDFNEILIKSTGPLLECWDILNVFCEILLLDSFTFDDFVEAMQFSSQEVECELFVEIHCAALKMLVASEKDGGRILVPLPEMGVERESDDEDGLNTIPNPTPELEIKSRGRTTRSSLTKLDLMQSKVTHRAAEMQAEVNWVDRLRKRDFKDGGWQVLIVGLLYQLSKSARYFNICENLLKELAPLNLDPTPETVRRQYSNLNINLRIQVLQILCMLIVETQAIRTYMEECSEQMTTFRKEKIQWQRDRKQYLEELRQLNDERKLLQPINMPPSPVSEKKNSIKLTEVDLEVHELVEDDLLDTDEDSQIRSLRRGHDRALDRKRKREALMEKKEKANSEPRPLRNTKRLTKILKDIEKKQDLIAKCESEIATLDNDLREADCPRTRILGRDRFFNRYIWFERNGMPYGGLPDSSTADAEYANGCIWIQGPDDTEREGFIEMKPEWQNEYKSKFQMTVTERKRIEEGETSVYNAYQWGFYEDPKDVDALIAWLDPRGCNELKLHKELKLFRDRIVSNMIKRKEYLSPVDQKSGDPSIRRMVTRRKELPVKNTIHRCLSWRNLMALSEIGHLHSEQPRTRKPVKKITLPSTPETTRSSKAESKSKNKRKFSAR